MSEDPFDLSRFVDAQAPVFDLAWEELKRGRKTGHWMWFVFPQIAGLGSSMMSRKYAIGSVAEAKAYLAHPLLGNRLRECVEVLLEQEGRSAHAIFGSPDDMKLCSCLTLFSEASGEEVFLRALDKYFGGEPDPETLRIVGRD
jgi:uncharacterized protein (DUF1810 family)